MLEGYITPSKDTPSRSGLYANGLPGVTLQLLDDLTKDEEEDFNEFWTDIYQRSIVNFTSLIQSKLTDKFHIDLSLISRETSKFGDDVNQSGLMSGITLYYRLPRYGKTQIVSVVVNSNLAQDIDFEFYIFDKDENGKILKTVNATLTEGENTINIDTYFSNDQIFIGYDATAYPDLFGTTNRYYSDYYGLWDDFSCWYPCYGGGRAHVTQVNGGGFNVVFNSVCSVEKVVEQNINIFKDAFWYFIGLELMFERIHSDKFNRWTTLSSDRAKELIGNYQAWAEEKSDNAIRGIRMKEDHICFSCKSLVTHSYELP